MSHSWTDVYIESVDYLKPDPFKDFYNSQQIRALGIKCGDNCLLHKTTLVYNAENVSLGSNVRIDAFNVLSAGQGFIRIGSYTHVSSHCVFIGANGIDIHDYSAVAAGCKLFSASDDFSGRSLIGPMVPRHTRNLKEGPVTLKKYTCLGVNCTIMPNATLSEGSFMLSNSLLIGKSSEYSILSGQPAKVIRPRLKDFLKFLPQSQIQDL